jgi:predicted nucleic acid-binding protein
MLLARLVQAGSGVAQGWLGEIEGASFLMNPTPDDFREAAGLICRHQDQALSMFDAVAAVVGRWLGLPVWTYDHRFDVVRVEVWRDA